MNDGTAQDTEQKSQIILNVPPLEKECVLHTDFSTTATELLNYFARRIFIECCQLTLSRFPRVNVRTRKSPHEFRLYEYMHSGGFELTKPKLTYTRTRTT